MILVAIVLSAAAVTGKNQDINEGKGVFL